MMRKIRFLEKYSFILLLFLLNISSVHVLYATDSSITEEPAAGGISGVIPNQNAKNEVVFIVGGEDISGLANDLNKNRKLDSNFHFLALPWHQRENSTSTAKKIVQNAANNKKPIKGVLCIVDADKFQNNIESLDPFANLYKDYQKTTTMIEHLSSIANGLTLSTDIAGSYPKTKKKANELLSQEKPALLTKNNALTKAATSLDLGDHELSKLVKYLGMFLDSPENCLKNLLLVFNTETLDYDAGKRLLIKYVTLMEEVRDGLQEVSMVQKCNKQVMPIIEFANLFLRLGGNDLVIYNPNDYTSVLNSIKALKTQLGTYNLKREFLPKPKPVPPSPFYGEKDPTLPAKIINDLDERVGKKDSKRLAVLLLGFPIKPGDEHDTYQEREKKFMLKQVCGKDYEQYCNAEYVFLPSIYTHKDNKQAPIYIVVQSARYLVSIIMGVWLVPKTVLYKNTEDSTIKNVVQKNNDTLYPVVKVFEQYMQEIYDGCNIQALVINCETSTLFVDGGNFAVVKKLTELDVMFNSFGKLLYNGDKNKGYTINPQVFWLYWYDSTDYKTQKKLYSSMINKYFVIDSSVLKLRYRHITLLYPLFRAHDKLADNDTRLEYKWVPEANFENIENGERIFLLNIKDYTDNNNNKDRIFTIITAFAQKSKRKPISSERFRFGIGIKSFYFFSHTDSNNNWAEDILDDYQDLLSTKRDTPEIDVNKIENEKFKKLEKRYREGAQSDDYMFSHETLEKRFYNDITKEKNLLTRITQVEGVPGWLRALSGVGAAIFFGWFLWDYWVSKNAKSVLASYWSFISSTNTAPNISAKKPKVAPSQVQGDKGQDIPESNWKGWVGGVLLLLLLILLGIGFYVREKGKK